ncbi:MAG TPA: hypothetical protein PK033_04760 [Acetivibrio sp.]|nr:hypothetical protein [Acetivibrio sp.]
MDEKLYIPMGVKTESEIFSGFGRKQLLQSIVGSIGAGVVAIFIWIFSHNVTPAVICVLTGIIGSVMMTTKDQTNLSVVDQVQNMVRFARSQKYYPYVYGDEWGIKENIRS